MAERYIAFDVETPNSDNNRMSAIGIAVVENGKIVEELSTLVNPETWFSRFNIGLTGITPELAADAPSFDELWPKIEALFSSGVLAAHNAPFDMSVLAKCLRAYSVDWRDTAPYVCTCQMGRRCYPELPNHRLNTLCEYRHIALDPPQAGSDSRACAALLLDYQESGLRAETFRREYDLVRLRTVRDTYRRGRGR
ncbi:MAG: 3'-5' exonuclease [Oscillospiraceae bacterium]|nr:3'-5' exonuclease [Oscillospiraceae bacterium]